MAERQEQQGHVVTVVSQDGANVLVSVPMLGFPEGFQLSPGARVVLVTTPSGHAVRPLARAVRASVPEEALGASEQVEAGGRTRRLQAATVVTEQPAEAAAPRRDEDVIWVVESEGDEPDQVIAVRRPRDRR
jgi:hypothetical protein